jgi:mannitol/fructose-specific phosphotransferase system IIA component (Ntr-type)
MDVANYDFADIHFAISTVQLPMPLPVPVLQVKAVLGYHDIRLIRSFLQNRNNVEPDLQQLLHVIEENCDVRDKAILEEQLKAYFQLTANKDVARSPVMPKLLGNKILVKQRVSNWEEAVRQSSQILLEYGDIRPGYIDALIEVKDRYQQYSFIGPGVCMPHAMDFDNVNRLAISFLTMQAPISVDIGDGSPQPIWLMIPLAMPDMESHLQLLREINALINFQPTFAQDIANCCSAKQIIAKLSQQLEVL